MNTLLVFELDKSKVLNANDNMHYMPKGKIVSYLRTLSAEKGLQSHPKELIPIVEKRMEAIISESNFIMIKRKARKKLKNASKMTEKEVNEQIDEELKAFKPASAKSDFDIPFLYEKFKVTITVSPPTKRRMDVPNLYPTVKALIDGLTDAGFWEDDDYSHMTEMSFKYGSPTKESGLFRFVLEIEETDEKPLN